MIPGRDHHLPPDPAAYRALAPARGRVIVIAPTRAACETIELALGVAVETILSRTHGEEIGRWAEGGTPFGIVAGTGTGKTLIIREIAERWLGETLRYGVVNREREATPETPTWNVVIVTTGIARRWLQDELITGRDTIIVDEIHQTSAELELCLALGKRAGCRFIWLSATVDPRFYAAYLGSREVLETSAFDPALRARVEVVAARPDEFLTDRYIKTVIRERRGVAVFVPTRAEVEQLAADLGARWPRLASAFYHGGQPIRTIRPFLEGQVEHPFLLAMTAAGQSALNLPGLDTVVIYDARYGNVVDRGRNVLHRMYLGANEILQMAGRVHGRVTNGRVTILSDRPLDFDRLEPTPPEFQLAGDAERVALTCAAIGVDATDLDLPVPLDREAYRSAVRQLEGRGIVADHRLTDYGRQVEALPVERPWAELLLRADSEIFPLVAVMATVESLHRMTRDERDLDGVAVKGSDHLTAYNLYAEVVNRYGRLGTVFGLPRHLFEEEGLAEWAARRGVLIKAIEDVALGTASVFRALDLPLPATLPYADRDRRHQWMDLVARVMSLDLAIDEALADGTPVRVSRTSLAGAWGPVAGSVRYFADRFGVPRASIEGTTLDYDLIRRYAVRHPPVLAVGGPRNHQGLVACRLVRYHGFDLEHTTAPLPGRVPEPLQASVGGVLARALMAGETYHPDQAAIRRTLRVCRDLYARSKGTLAAVGDAAIEARLREQLEAVTSWGQFLATPFRLENAEQVAPAERERWMALPASVTLRGDTAPIQYGFWGSEPVARLRLREGQVRRLTPDELPRLDRLIRLVVPRSDGPDLEGESLAALRDALAAQHRQRTPVHERRHRVRRPIPRKRRR